MRVVGLSFLIILSISRCCVCADEEGTPHPGKIVWEYPQSSLTITNNEPEEITIDTLRVRMIEFEDDLAPRPIFLFQPFLDEFVVTVVNLGWGDFEGQQLHLHNSQHLDRVFSQNFGSQTIGPMVFQLDSASAKNLHFPIPSEPKFGFMTYGAFEFNDMEPPLLTPADSFPDLYQPPPQPMDIFEQYSNLPHRQSDDYESQYWELGKSGFVIAFSGQLNGETFRYYPYSLPSVQAAKKTPTTLSRSANLLGGLYSDFELYFGDLIPPPEAAGKVARGGVSIDLSKKPDGEWIDIPVPLQILPSKARCELTLQFLHKRSKKFRIEVEPLAKFNVVGAKTIALSSLKLPAPTIPKFNCIVPRQLNLNYATTERLIKEFHNSRPHYRTLANDLMNSGLVQFPSKADFAQRCQQSRQFSQALLFLSICEPNSNEFQTGLDKMATWLESLLELHRQDNRKPKLSRAEEPLIGVAWPIFCKARSEKAAEFAVEACSTRDTSLVSIALMVPETQQLLRGNYAAQLHQVLHRTLKNKPKEISQEELMIASAVNYKLWDGIELSVLDDSILAVAAASGAHKVIDQHIRQRIQNAHSRARTGRLIFSLMTNQSWQFVDTVCDECNNLLSGTEHIEFIRACASYLAAVPQHLRSIKWAETMGRLRVYEFSPEVRQAASGRQSNGLR